MATTREQRRTDKDISRKGFRLNKTVKESLLLIHSRGVTIDDIALLAKEKQQQHVP